jgi:hypothetical protein
MSGTDRELRPVSCGPRGAPRGHIVARTTAWLIEQRARARATELENARLQGELSASERIERSAQRYADRLEVKLAEARRREASLARALGYVESERDQLRERLGLPAGARPGLGQGSSAPRARRGP